MTFSTNKVDSIHGIKMINNIDYRDDRGEISKIPNKVLKLFFKSVSQINILITKNNEIGIVRGLHAQYEKNDESKFVMCIEGKIQEYFLDLRANSKTFGKYMTIKLGAKDRKSVFIPPGIAHGYQTLEKKTTILYVLSVDYDSRNQIRVNFFDKDLGINLPLKPTKVSKKDLKSLSFKNSLKVFKE
jgi:dTDP-4-dehydrorhamnose 3,5-epimerase